MCKKVNKQIHAFVRLNFIINVCYFYKNSLQSCECSFSFVDITFTIEMQYFPSNLSSFNLVTTNVKEIIVLNSVKIIQNRKSRKEITFKRFEKNKYNKHHEE